VTGLPATEPGTGPVVKLRKGPSALERRRRRRGLLCVLPLVSLVLVAIGLPLGQAIYYSLTDWDGITSTFVGLSNYSDGIIKNPNIEQIVGNNILILLSIPIGVALSFVIAYVLYRGAWGGKVFRAVYFLPTAFSWVVIGIAARGVLLSTGGLNSLLNAVGLGSLTRDWLGEPHTAIAGIIFTFNWAVLGLNTVILLAGMATLDKSVFEAAQLDGAGHRAMMRHIVLPWIRRFVDLVLVITIVAALTQIFALIYVMTSGGPGYATTTLEFALYQEAFSVGSFGVAAALGVILLTITLIIAGIQLRTGTRKEGAGS
jgi:ABC-type sugar transport system permease subunit